MKFSWQELDLIPREINHETGRPWSDSELTDCRAIYLAMIAHAMRDATGTIGPSLTRSDRDDARQWLTRRSPDLQEFCLLAGVEVDQIISLAKIKIAAHIEGVELPKAKRPAKPSRAKMYTYNGKTMSIAQWAEATGIHKATLKSRIDHLGWTFKQAITMSGDGRAHHRRAHNRKLQDAKASMVNEPLRIMVNNRLNVMINNELTGGRVETCHRGNEPAGDAQFDSASIQSFNLSAHDREDS